MSSHKNSAVFAAAVFQLRVLCCRLFIAASRASLSDAAPGRSLLSGGAHHRSLFLSSLASSLASSLLSDAALRQQPAELRRAPLQPSPHNTFIAASFSAALFSAAARSAAAYSAAASRAASLSAATHTHVSRLLSGGAPCRNFPFSSAARSLSLSDAALSAAACLAAVRSAAVFSSTASRAASLASAAFSASGACYAEDLVRNQHRSTAVAPMHVSAMKARHHSG